MSASDEAVELLPCPFCGKSDVELRQSITDAYIACNECGCRTGLAYYGSSDVRNAWEDRHVAKIWNTRANHTAAMKEALEEGAITDSKEALAHDLEQQMTIAKIECNRAEQYRSPILRTIRGARLTPLRFSNRRH